MECFLREQQLWNWDFETSIFLWMVSIILRKMKIIEVLYQFFLVGLLFVPRRNFSWTFVPRFLWFEGIFRLLPLSFIFDASFLIFWASDDESCYQNLIVLFSFIFDLSFCRFGFVDPVCLHSDLYFDQILLLLLLLLFLLLNLQLSFCNGQIFFVCTSSGM